MLGDAFFITLFKKTNVFPAEVDNLFSSFYLSPGEFGKALREKTEEWSQVWYVWILKVEQDWSW